MPVYEKDYKSRKINTRSNAVALNGNNGINNKYSYNKDNIINNIKNNRTQ